MSYEIERGKRVLEIPNGLDPRFKGYDGGTHLYLMSHDSNNVSPRRFDWRLIAVQSRSVWNGEIMLPHRIWEMGYDADGGSIKPWNKEVTGLNYVKAWKTTAAKPLVMFEGDKLLWDQARVSIWTGMNVNDGFLDRLKVEGIAMFKECHNRKEIYEAYKRLFPEDLDRTWEGCILDTPAQMFDALYLWRNRENLPFSYGIKADENDPFLRSKE